MTNKQLVTKAIQAERGLQDLKTRADQLLDAGQFDQALSMKPTIEKARANVQEFRAELLKAGAWSHNDVDQVPAAELFQIVAGHLTGKKIDLEFYALPKDEFDAGECVNRAGGETTIRITQLISTLEGRFTVFLHECAHALYDHHGQQPEFEDQAKEQVRAWRTFADQNKHRVGSTKENNVVRSLRALLLWRDPRWT